MKYRRYKERKRPWGRGGREMGPVLPEYPGCVPTAGGEVVLALGTPSVLGLMVAVSSWP